MFFQVNITPKPKKTKESIIKEENEANKIHKLSLAPFQAPTHIKMETDINVAIKSILNIENPNNHSATISITKIPPQERCISTNSNQLQIQPKSNASLEIIWHPKESGAWRETIQLTDNRRGKHDVFLVLNCKTQNKKGKIKTELKLDKKLIKQSCSNINNENKTKTLTSNKNFDQKNKNKCSTQPAVKRTISNTVESDKENISNNLNWLIDQARIKKQKRDYSPSKDFSQILNSSSFKFTPLNTKSQTKTCQTTTNENVFDFSPKKIDVNNPESWTIRQSVIMENKVETYLRKETYITVPKYLNIPTEKSENYERDSLSPKLDRQSDFSMLLNDIKFTPLKKDKKVETVNPFSPKSCSFGEEPKDVSNPFKNGFDDSVSIKNITFEMDTPDCFKNSKNNSFELNSSPICPENSVLKPIKLDTNFKKQNFNIEFSTPINRNKPVYNSQILDSAKKILEADLWIKKENKVSLNDSTLFSITEEKNLVQAAKNAEQVPMCQQAENFYEFKEPEAVCIEISPPKRQKKRNLLNRLSPSSKISSPINKKKNLTKGKVPLDISNLTKTLQIDNKTINGKIPTVISKLSLAKLRKPCKKSKKKDSKMDDSSDFMYTFYNPDPFAATMTYDPFLTSSIYCNEQWISNQEIEFKKWLNALLTPPEDLNVDIESNPIDVGKIWQACRGKDNITLAETKESVCLRYHTNVRLNTLRKAALAMYQRKEILIALKQTTVGIEKEILQVRSDRDLHKDIGLQKIILELLLSYNPLWLRIGLETIYGESIPLRSNDDLTGLTKFLLNRFFSDPHLVKTHSHSMHPNIRLPSFQGLINKYILKKFLYLVYFLDFAKNNKLIGHDPCLFHKRSTTKDSRSILLEFSRQTLAGIGDITKVLRFYGYVVTHKQTPLDEYDYAVASISTDLRDGVRLCRVMEIITGKKCLTCRCRLPAISRLQRVHNVNVALSSLFESGYNIQGNIDGKCIADGHREKTLSLLWQIIYKFQAPRYEKAAKTLQKWWRSKLCYIRIKNILKNIKNHSASVIQRSWRCYLARKEFKILKENYYKDLKLKEEAARKIQIYWRAKNEMKQQQKYFQHLKLSITKIQKWWRRIYHTREHVKLFNEKRILIRKVQQKWRAKRLMNIERNSYLEKKSNAIKIQNYWRSYKLSKLIYNDYQNSKKLVVLMQRKWRAKILMRKNRDLYLRKLKAINNIKIWWKRYLIYKKDRNNFIQLKSSVRNIENLWIAKVEGKRERENFLLQKSSANVIKKSWKRYNETKKYVQKYKTKQKAIVQIQSWWRMIVQLNKYKKIRQNCVILQNWWRSVLLTRNQNSEFLLLKKSAICIQKNWRMKKCRSTYLQKKSAVLKIELWYLNLIISRNVREEYLRVKASVKIIENRWKSLKKTRMERESYLEKRRACMTIQSRWRAQMLMKRERENYLKIKTATIKIQSSWRMILQKRAYKKLLTQIKAANLIKSKWKAVKLGKTVRVNYLKQYSSIVLLQRKWKAILLGNSLRLDLEKKRKAAIIIQKNWKCYVMSREYRKKKASINFIKNWIRHKQEGARVRKEYLELRDNVVKMQRLWKTNRQFKRFNRQREAAIIIQKYWRSYLAVKNYRKIKTAVRIIEDRRIQTLHAREIRLKYLELRKGAILIQSSWRRHRVLKALSVQREAAIKIQRFWRSYREMKILRQQFVKKREAAITIQNYYRARNLGSVERRKYQMIIVSVIRIQRWWKQIILSKKNIELKLKRKWAVRTIEKWWISSCERLLEKERLNLAATKIQAAWKGYKIRKMNCRKLEGVRERARKAAEAAVPTATLAYRLQESVEFFINAENIGQLSICLSSLDVITRLSPNACINVCQLNLVTKLYDVLTVANRSLPWLEICLKDISILLTLAKFNKTKQYVCKAEHIQLLARLLNISYDKKDDLFLNTATLFWMLIEDEDYANEACHCTQTKYLLTTLLNKVNNSKTAKLNLNLSKIKTDHLPSPKPDWGLNHKRPRTFKNSSQAIIAIAEKLNIGLNHSKTDMHKSLNFTFQ